MPRRILLADDSVTAQNMGKKILSDAGYEVITVSNGSAALKKANELLPDICVLDVYMPGYSGLEVCKLLKENTQTAEIPILLTVGKLEPFKSDEALKAKANAFIVKPFEATELLAVIRKIEEANAKPERKVAKPPKVSALAKAFAPTAAAEAPDPDAGIEEKGWKNRLGMPSKKKAEPDPEEEQEQPAMGTAFRDLAPVATEDFGLRRESAFTADPIAASAPAVIAASAPAEVPLDISPEEIAAIRAAVEVLSGQGDHAPVLHVAADGMPRHLAPEPEELPEELAAAEAVSVPQVPAKAVIVVEDPTNVPEQIIAAPAAITPSELQSERTSSTTPQAAHWKAESIELTKAEAETSLEREMQEALGTTDTVETFNTYSLGSFAESSVAEPVEDEPIISEVAAAEAATAQAAAAAEPAVAIAVAASASGDSNTMSSSASTISVVADSAGAAAVEAATSANPATGFQDLRPMASAAAATVAGPSPDVAVGGISRESAPSTSKNDASVSVDRAASVDLSAPDDEIDSRTKSQMDAAWSNWRDIRNTIVTPKLTEQLAEVVAATAQDGSAEEPANSATEGHDASSISNIVDSVLAEMRPKLMEEIARKLASKKQ